MVLRDLGTMKSLTSAAFLRLTAVLIAVILLSSGLSAGVIVTKADILEGEGLEVNGAGPMIIRIDEARGRLISVNTLSSSVSIIDCETEKVFNIPLAGRGFQHLKAECLTVNGSNGDIYLIGRNCFYIVSVDNKSSMQIATERQFESIAVDEGTGNIFLAGRESRKLGFFSASSLRLKDLDWLDSEEELINLNATPPPPIRKVIADNSLGRIIAVDGVDPAIYIFDAQSGKLTGSRPLGLSAGGRYHLGGYDQEAHRLYLVIETAGRKVVEAASIDAVGNDDLIVSLPGYTEGVGIIFNEARGELYIPYDNHPSVHVVDFGGGGELYEIAVPAYGNDGSAVDVENDILYIASWAFGEIDVIDLEKRRLEKRVKDLGIIPHMFTLAFDPGSGLVYFPKGATAVNGTFGSAVSYLEPVTERTGKIRTGWAPVDLIERTGQGSFLVFGSEDRFAEVRADGSYEVHALPFDYPVRAAYGPEGDICLSYGPHQSYWPTVYIWGAKNGILTIGAEDLSFYDRRIPRQAHELVPGPGGALYFTQNNWGKEEQFVGVLKDQVRVFNVGERIRLGDEVEREITQRILRYDPSAERLYLVRVGEKDNERSILQIIDPDSSRVDARIELGLTATDLEFDGKRIYVSNFDSRSVSIVDKSDFSVSEIDAGEQPLMLCRCGEAVYLIDHSDNMLREIGQTGRRSGGAKRPEYAVVKEWKIPEGGCPDNIFDWGGDPVITSHSKEALFITRFDRSGERFILLHREEFPYGDTRFDSRNVSFYMRGQFGDAIFTITRGKTASDGNFWITDFLSGKVFILEDDRQEADRL